MRTCLGWLTVTTLPGEEYTQFKGLLLDYVDLIGADVNATRQKYLERLLALLKLVDRFWRTCRRFPPGPARCSPSSGCPAGLSRTGNNSPPGTAPPTPVPARTSYEPRLGQALGQLITNARRILAASGTVYRGGGSAEARRLVSHGRQRHRRPAL